MRTALNPSTLMSQCNSVSSWRLKILSTDNATSIDFSCLKTFNSVSIMLNIAFFFSKSYNDLLIIAKFGMNFLKYEHKPKKFCNLWTSVGNGKFVTASIPFFGFISFSIIRYPRYSISVNKNLHLSALISNLFPVNNLNIRFNTHVMF